jgi:MFS family permease
MFGSMLVHYAITWHVTLKTQSGSVMTLFAIAGVGMLGISLSQSLALVVAGAFLIGFTFSVFMPAGYSKATQSVPAGAATPAIAVYCCSHQLGQFLTPLVINAVSAPFGDAHFGGVAVKFLLAFFILIVMFALSALRERSGRSRHAEK